VIDIFKYKILTIILVICMLFMAAGCQEEPDEENAYNIETDEEFHQAVEHIMDRFLREDDQEAIYNELFEEFGDRYTEDEIRVHVRALLEEQEDQLSAELEIVQGKIEEAEEKIAELDEVLEDKADGDAIQELEEELAPLKEWIEKLDLKIEETEDFYRKMELYEEKENTLLMTAEIMENKIETVEKSEDEEQQGAGAFFNYHHKIEELKEKDQEIQEAYESVTGDNFISEQVLHDELQKNIIPDSEDLLDELEDVELDTDEIRDVHQTFKEARSTLLQAYSLWVEAIQEEEQDMVDEAIQLAEEGETLRETFYKELEQLLQRYTN